MKRVQLPHGVESRWRPKALQVEVPLHDANGTVAYDFYTDPLPPFSWLYLVIGIGVLFGGALLVRFPVRRALGFRALDVLAEADAEDQSKQPTSDNEQNDLSQQTTPDAETKDQSPQSTPEEVGVSGLLEPAGRDVVRQLVRYGPYLHPKLDEELKTLHRMTVINGRLEVADESVKAYAQSYVPPDESGLWKSLRPAALAALLAFAAALGITIPETAASGAFPLLAIGIPVAIKLLGGSDSKDASS